MHLEDFGQHIKVLETFVLAEKCLAQEGQASVRPGGAVLGDAGEGAEVLMHEF